MFVSFGGTCWLELEIGDYLGEEEVLESLAGEGARTNGANTREQWVNAERTSGKGDSQPMVKSGCGALQVPTVKKKKSCLEQT